jgi:hypothetical protein
MKAVIMTNVDSQRHPITARCCNIIDIAEFNRHIE